MMNLNEILAKIKGKGAEIAAKRKENEEYEQSIVFKGKEAIKELAPRIKNLLTIGHALQENGIGIYSELVADPSNPNTNLGFCLNYHDGGKLIGVGVIVLFGRNLIVDENGDIDSNIEEFPRVFAARAEEFLRDFDDFERRVLEVVNNL